MIHSPRPRLPASRVRPLRLIWAIRSAGRVNRPSHRRRILPQRRMSYQRWRRSKTPVGRQTPSAGRLNPFAGPTNSSNPITVDQEEVDLFGESTLRTGEDPFGVNPESLNVGDMSFLPNNASPVSADKPVAKVPPKEAPKATPAPAPASPFVESRPTTPVSETAGRSAANPFGHFAGQISHLLA